MNKLINRISPETSENRILHAGFSIILMSEEITQTLSGLSSDMIIFILSGSITIYSTKEEKKTIGEQYEGVSKFSPSFLCPKPRLSQAGALL